MHDSLARVSRWVFVLGLAAAIHPQSLGSQEPAACEASSDRLRGEWHFTYLLRADKLTVGDVKEILKRIQTVGGERGEGLPDIFDQHRRQEYRDYLERLRRSAGERPDADVLDEGCLGQDSQVFVFAGVEEGGRARPWTYTRTFLGSADNPKPYESRTFASPEFTCIRSLNFDTTPKASAESLRSLEPTADSLKILEGTQALDRVALFEAWRDYERLLRHLLALCNATRERKGMPTLDSREWPPPLIIAGKEWHSAYPKNLALVEWHRFLVAEVVIESHRNAANEQVVRVGLKDVTGRAVMTFYSRWSPDGRPRYLRRAAYHPFSDKIQHEIEIDVTERRDVREVPALATILSMPTLSKRVKGQDHRGGGGVSYREFSRDSLPAELAAALPKTKD